MPSTTFRLVLIRGLKIRPTFILFVAMVYDFGE